MSHNYLFNLYDYIDQRLAEMEQALTRIDASEDARQFAAGRIEVLCEVERFMNARFDIKLPKRMRKLRSVAPAVCTRRAFDD